MASSETFNAEGGCSCGEVRFRITSAPIFTHGCHCTDCQRLSGGAFAINAMIETDRVEVLAGTPKSVPVSTPSGKGQNIMRCPTCNTALWSHYGGAGDKLAFVRAGTLDDTSLIEPDIHIFTRSKQPWVILPEGKPAVEVYYDAKEMFPAEGLARMGALRG
ncbi:MAG: GFA family protein [Alphaproteobacteria bacterium]|jgi:hypothetical protein|nr:GFA family protein [Rhodospirillaceae bacterium]MBT6510026.1 GFA family protein [Rhodospirillaceae bacterium]MBT7615462.1 GFA family protein [Rhodospirillaceae bacterium]MBT7647659.1 GFA family protein [Rhodospirillaceae bacterium]MDG2479548.1 GFA family protein [Alphaproteobacteria bacterium]